jgi:NAD-reducing hydrogenase small subunit
VNAPAVDGVAVSAVAPDDEAVIEGAVTEDAVIEDGGKTVAKAKLATIWLDGCSGCHMSFLDIDERLLLLAERADLVYGCLVDTKEFPEGVDVTLVEGAVSSSEDLRKIREVRERSRLVVSLGDCAVTSNVPGMRNPFGPKAILTRAYLENATLGQQIPTDVPTLLAESLPVHAYVPVDVFVPGCPPSADRIFEVVLGLLDGHLPDAASPVRFG